MNRPTRNTLFGCVLCLILAGLYSCTAKADERSSVSLEQQARCATQAERIFKQLGWDYQRDSFRSHVNVALNRCFVEIVGHATIGGTSKVLMDAYEQREYANYMWIPKNGKKYWEVPPMVCTLSPLGAPQRACSSDEQYQAFVQLYLEE